MGLSPMQPPLL